MGVSEGLDALAAMVDAGADAATLKTAIEAIRENDLREASVNAPASSRARISAEEMSSEVVGSNPYSRLMALQRMGIVHEYKKIRDKAVAVVGVGGVGSVAAEMLARCGVGRLQLYDFDTVELANMNRLFFRPEHAGMTKTDAANSTLYDINPDVQCQSYHLDVTTMTGFETFRESLVDPVTGRSRVDLVLACVDNYEARMSVNQCCLEMNQVWMESGVSEDAVSGHVQTMKPGATACFACNPPLIVASGIDEKTLRRDGVCAASLPTTMGIVSGMLVQASLKHMLSFGESTRYLGYSALKDFFPAMDVLPNPECDNAACRRAQERHRAWVTSPEYIAKKAAEAEAARVRDEAEAAKSLHDANEWSISVENSDGDGGNTQRGTKETKDTTNVMSPPAEGIEFAMPRRDVLDDATVDRYRVADTDAGVDDLMAQLKNLQSGDAR